MNRAKGSYVTPSDTQQHIMGVPETEGYKEYLEK